MNQSRTCGRTGRLNGGCIVVFSQVDRNSDNESNCTNPALFDHDEVNSMPSSNTWKMNIEELIIIQHLRPK
jgi:hypothetical protein